MEFIPPQDFESAQWESGFTRSLTNVLTDVDEWPIKHLSDTIEASEI